jgi:hypothetical protein
MFSDDFLFFNYLTAVAYDRGDPVLVYSDRGVSRSAAVIVAFISFHMRMSSQVSIGKMIRQLVRVFCLFKCLASFEIC